jgi:nudix-type nucleoside diphosphatase (YffH/AdpP family)
MPVELRDIRTVYQGYCAMMLTTMVGADGATYTREIEHHGRGAAVLPYDPERRMAMLVRQPRAPVIWAGGPAELTEVPAGMIDPNDPDPAAAVRREALEEVGLRLGDLEPVGCPFSSPGVSSERLDLFLGAYSLGSRETTGGGLATEHEDITVIEISLDDLWASVEALQVEDLKTLALVLALRVRHPELFTA